MHMDGYNGGTMKPRDKSKNGVGYMGVCHGQNLSIDCRRCGILCTEKDGYGIHIKPNQRRY